MFDSSTVMLYPLNFVIQVPRFQKFTWKESQQFMLLRHFDGLKGINSSKRDWVGVDGVILRGTEGYKPADLVGSAGYSTTNDYSISYNIC